MALYMEYSSRIYKVYLKYIAPEDMHVYSIDEVFMDVTAYLNTYQMSAEELAGQSSWMFRRRLESRLRQGLDESVSVQGSNGYRGKTCQPMRTGYGSHIWMR